MKEIQSPHSKFSKKCACTPNVHASQVLHEGWGGAIGVNSATWFSALMELVIYTYIRVGPAQLVNHKVNCSTSSHRQTALDRQQKGRGLQNATGLLFSLSGEAVWLKAEPPGSQRWHVESSWGVQRLRLAAKEGLCSGMGILTGKMDESCNQMSVGMHLGYRLLLNRRQSPHDLRKLP